MVIMDLLQSIVMMMDQATAATRSDATEVSWNYLGSLVLILVLVLITGTGKTCY